MKSYNKLSEKLNELVEKIPFLNNKIDKKEEKNIDKKPEIKKITKPKPSVEAKNVVVEKTETEPAVVASPIQKKVTTRKTLTVKPAPTAVKKPGIDEVKQTTEKVVPVKKPAVKKTILKKTVEPKDTNNLN